MPKRAKKGFPKFSAHLERFYARIGKIDFFNSIRAYKDYGKISIFLRLMTLASKLHEKLQTRLKPAKKGFPRFSAYLGGF